MRLGTSSRSRHAAAFTLFGLLSCGIAVAQPLGLEPIVSGLASPVTLAPAGDGSNRLFIVEQGGTIRVFDGTRVLSTPFLDISAKVLFDGGERGLLGLAFDANYSSNGLFYVYYTHQQTAQFTTGMIIIARYKVSADPNVADPNSELVLLTQDHSTNANHNGGSLLWGPDDGCLYAGIGDGGGAGDQPNNAQNLGILLGKIVRIKPSDGTACAGNPFIGMTGVRPEIWALGLRNPWRITFDRQTHDLLIADVGQNTEEEVDFQPAGVGGQNYQWSCKEGLLPFNTGISCTAGRSTAPVLVYDHVNGNCAVIGGYRYRGSRFPSLAGTYVYGDLCTGQIWGGVQSGNTWTSSPLLLSGLSISTFGEDEAGEVYVVNYSSTAGAIYRLVLLQQPNTHDFNGDGMSDILWRDTSGNAAIWFMNGTTIKSIVGLGNVGTTWQIVGQRDFNGDGFADILWRNTNGGIAVWLMNGGTVMSSVGLGNVPSNWQIVGTGDFNGDGFADILWRDSNGGGVAMWLMHGGMIISSLGVGNVPTNWVVAGTGDFKGDGRWDILWRDNTSGGVAMWLMNGGTINSSLGVGNVPTNWVIAGTGDFNGDRNSDILWRDNNSGGVAMWLMNGATVTSSLGIGNVPNNWQIAQTGDYNGDGKSDILWRDNNSGGVAMWLMSGGSIISSLGVGSVPTDWQIQGLNAD